MLNGLKSKPHLDITKYFRKRYAPKSEVIVKSLDINAFADDGVIPANKIYWKILYALEATTIATAGGKALRKPEYWKLIYDQSGRVSNSSVQVYNQSV